MPMKSYRTYLNWMKNNLVFLFLFSTGTLFYAQTYTTGVVNLSATSGLAMSVKIDIGTQVTLTLSGPINRWFAIGFNTSTMGSGIDVAAVHSAGTLSAFDASIGGYVAPTADLQQNWTISSDQVASGVRTIVATRLLNTGDPNDFVFSASTGSLSLIWARAASNSFSYSYHGSSNRGAVNANFTLIPPPSPPEAPTGSMAQTFCSGDSLAQLSATGTAIQWYASSTGGSPLSGSTSLINGLTYYATQTVNGVESTNRLSVTVTENTIPTNPTAITGAVHFCNDGGESYSIAPVSGATSYVWTTPNGTTGSSIGTTINLLFNQSFNAGMLSVLAQNSCGQSQVTSLNINQHVAYTNTLNVTACGSYNFNGQSYAQSGTYPFQGTTIWGCDSVVVLNLTIVSVFTTNITEAACGSFNWNNQTFFEGGLFSDTLQSSAGCDSIVNLNLTIHPIESISIDSTLFDSFEWNGQLYTTSGQYTQFFTSSNGCDSTVTINLTILDSGISESEEVLNIFPNPLSGNQVLSISGINSGSFQLINLQGHELRSGNFTTHIDLNGIDPGVYYILVGTQRKRILII